MGVRALIEKIMISKVGDHGTFTENVAAFRALSLLSDRAIKRLETTIDAGHAANHRAFLPDMDDLRTMMDVTEHFIHSVYLQDLIRAAREGGMAAVCATEQYKERIAAYPPNGPYLMGLDSEHCHRAPCVGSRPSFGGLSDPDTQPAPAATGDGVEVRVVDDRSRTPHFH